MKKIGLLFIFSLVFSSCKNDAKKAIESTIEKESFPTVLAKVFEKHGGLDVWKKAQILSFNKGEEVHTSDLYSRKTVIHSPKYSLGFDGKEVWLSQEGSSGFSGDKDFYYNLYFYFYAMPFVLADDGIMYEKVDDLVFESENYPGYKISFKSDKGTSPDDTYFVYYNPQTFQMEWLGYTVTFFDKKVSEDVQLIKYNKWESETGLLLPKEITWYKMDANGQPTIPAKPATVFTLPLISEGELSEAFFEKPLQ
jgi:hypothetical protein